MLHGWQDVLPALLDTVLSCCVGQHRRDLCLSWDLHAGEQATHGQSAEHSKAQRLKSHHVQLAAHDPLVAPKHDCCARRLLQHQVLSCSSSSSRLPQRQSGLCSQPSCHCPCVHSKYQGPAFVLKRCISALHCAGCRKGWTAQGPLPAGCSLAAACLAGLQPGSRRGTPPAGSAAVLWGGAGQRTHKVAIPEIVILA